MGSWIGRWSSLFLIIVVYASFLMSDVACRWWGSKPQPSSFNWKNFIFVCVKNWCKLTFCIFWMKIFFGKKIKTVIIMYYIILSEEKCSFRSCHRLWFILYDVILCTKIVRTIPLKFYNLLMYFCIYSDVIIILYMNNYTY